ncbi:MAG: hypothetical protein WC979_07375 [Candidatus Pacearchaeota archaeon]|jgi:hypothetical protein
MAKKKVKNKVVKKIRKNTRPWLYYSPRILTILFILFISLFALDVFGNNYTFLETVQGLFMHLIPSMILIVFLIIAWKHEWVGAVGFFLFALLYIGMIVRKPLELYMLSYSLTIAGPSIIVAILWWANWAQKK